MKINKFSPTYTHEKGRASKNISPQQELERSVLACMLFEDTFYEDGISIEQRISSLSKKVDPEVVLQLAVKTYKEFKIRHVPLLMITNLFKTHLGKPLADAIEMICTRPDQMTELLSIYWKDGRKPLSAQLKKGLAKAFCKFDEYQLSKWNKDTPIKLRDIMFLTHPRPKDKEQEDLFKRVASNTLKTPETWEVKLSATKGNNKEKAWEELLKEGKIGYLALLKNLRNMMEANVDIDLIRKAILERKGASKILPFRFISAMEYAPALFNELDYAFMRSVDELEKFDGTTAILIDVSGSMEASLSQHSQMKRLKAASALAAMFPGNKRIFTFSYKTMECVNMSGLGLINQIYQSQPHGGTYLARAITDINNHCKFDRMIVITDEQSHDGITNPACEKAYIINVAPYQKGVGYGRWVHISGFSEATLKYIQAYENSLSKD
jgi:hypothetical protein